MASVKKRPDTGQWQAKIRRKGHPPQTRCFRTQALALEWVRKTENAMLDQTDKGPPRRMQQLFLELLEKYSRDSTAKKRGRAQEESRMPLFEAHLGYYRLSELTTEHIHNMVDARRREGISDDTMRRELAQLSGVFTWAIDVWGYAELQNPVRPLLRAYNKQHVLKPKVQRDRRLRPGEYRRLLHGARFNPMLRQIIRLTIALGFRRGDDVSVRPGNLRADGLFIEYDKMGKPVVIPISRKARRIIEGLDKDGFGVRGDSITRAFRRACKRAGIEDLRFHDLRHEGISRLFERGLTIEEVAMVSRHADWRSLKIYTQLSREKIAAKMG